MKRTIYTPYNSWATLQEIDKPFISILIKKGFVQTPLMDRFEKKSILIWRSYMVKDKKLQSCWILTKEFSKGLEASQKYETLESLINTNISII